MIIHQIVHTLLYNKVFFVYEILFVADVYLKSGLKQLTPTYLHIYNISLKGRLSPMFKRTARDYYVVHLTHMVTGQKKI